MKRNEIALTLYTVRDFCQTEKDLLNTLNKIKKIGYNAIQVSSIGPINPIEIKKMYYRTSVFMSYWMMMFHCT